MFLLFFSGAGATGGGGTGDACLGGSAAILGGMGSVWETGRGAGGSAWAIVGRGGAGEGAGDATGVGWCEGAGCSSSRESGRSLLISSKMSPKRESTERSSSLFARGVAGGGALTTGGEGGSVTGGGGALTTGGDGGSATGATRVMSPSSGALNPATNSSAFQTSSRGKGFSRKAEALQSWTALWRMACPL